MKGASRIGSLLGKLKPAPPLPDMKEAAGMAIVMYHGIVKANPSRFNYRFLDVKDLKKQLLFFKEHFRLLSIPEYFGGPSAKSKITAAITFDDGYANNFHYALPLLEELKIPATIYVSTAALAGKTMLLPDLIDIYSGLHNEPFSAGKFYFRKNRAGYYAEQASGRLLREMEKEWEPSFKEEISTLLTRRLGSKAGSITDYWQLLNEAQLRQIGKSSYVSLGTHGISHHALSHLAPGEAETELVRPKEYLESLSGKAITSMAYPYGSYTRELIAMAQKAGYKEQLAVNYLFPEDPADPGIQNRIGLYPTLHCNAQLAAVVRHAKSNLL